MRWRSYGSLMCERSHASLAVHDIISSFQHVAVVAKESGCNVMPPSLPLTKGAWSCAHHHGVLISHGRLVLKKNPPHYSKFLYLQLQKGKSTLSFKAKESFNLLNFFRFNTYFHMNRLTWPEETRMLRKELCNGRKSTLAPPPPPFFVADGLY